MQKVMIIEDDLDLATCIATGLMQSGFDVAVARDRDDAAGLLDRFVPDVILLDYWMPGTSATTFTRRTRAEFPKTKIVVITAANDAQPVARMLGADAYYPKPFDPIELAGFLQKITP